MGVFVFRSEDGKISVSTDLGEKGLEVLDFVSMPEDIRSYLVMDAEGGDEQTKFLHFLNVFG